MLLPTLLAQFGDRGLQPTTGRFLIDTTSAAAANCSTLTTLEMTISRIIGILTVIAALFFVAYFFIAALQWVTAGGDAGQIGKARDKMIQGVVGLIVIVASYSIIGLVGTIVGINILNPRAQLDTILGRCDGSNSTDGGNDDREGGR